MFWGSFDGYSKGPGFFWEKSWGFINAESYQEHTVPIIHQHIAMRHREGREVILMHDNAPAHRSTETRAALRNLDITPLD
jgi:hypothetical protein